jgi:GNAT superfamily N-acetyltransferase
MPPGKNIDDLWTIFRSGLWRLWYKLSAEGKTRFYTEFFPLLHDTKHDVLGPRDDDSYYLVYLGTRPSARGRGHAKKLIAHMTARADREGRATYLESSAESNVAYYERFGFVAKKTIALKRGLKPVVLHIMVREPRAAAESSKGMENAAFRAPEM